MLHRASLTDVHVRRPPMEQQRRALVVLVIDEAQHALTTEAGASALFALKAARDQINSSAHHGFRLLDASRADALLLQQTRAALEEARREFMRQVNSLPPLQAAVLQTMAETGDQYAPFRSPTLTRYKAVCAQLSAEEHAAWLVNSAGN